MIINDLTITALKLDSKSFISKSSIKMSGIRLSMFLMILTICSSVVAQEVELISGDLGQSPTSIYMLEFKVNGLSGDQPTDKVWVRHKGEDTNEYTLTKRDDGTFRVGLILSQGENTLEFGNDVFTDSGNRTWKKGGSWSWSDSYNYSLLVEVVGKDKGDEGPFALSGEVVDDATNVSLPMANLYFPKTEQGYNTDIDGRFDMVLPKGEHLLEVSFIGFRKLTLSLIVNNQGAFTIRLKEDATELEAVVITAQREDQNVKSTELGKEVLSIGTIERLPPFVGEVDVLKSLTLLPGISTVGEASSGFNVRGGGTDQNLILLGGTTLYNPSHFFGFFSSFNSDLVKDVTVYKGGIPAKYGGRASSIIDIGYKDGDFNKWSGKISVGMISTKISADGPIIKDKLSIILGGRMSYANWLLARSADVDVANSNASFWDGNIMLNYRITDGHSLKYSYYRSFDDFSFASDTTQGWTNKNQNLTYNGKFSDKLFGTVSASRSEYDFNISSDFDFSSFELKSSILENGINADLEYEFSPTNSLTFGAQTKKIEINPGDRVPLTDNSSVNPFIGDPEQAIESGLFFQHSLDLTNRLRLSYGLRYSNFNYIGPKDVYVYDPLQTRTIQNITDTLSYGDGESIIKHGGLEPRASLRITTSESSSIKLGFNRINQFIHLVSNTAAISPTDTWKLSDTNIDPALVDQYSIGLFKNFSNNTLETSVEGYYKDMNGIQEYKDGAELFLNNHLETELVEGIGRSYGVEFYIKKKKGKSTGWISYTFSKSERKVIGSFPDEIINQGEWFDANFDRPHDLTAVAEHKLSPYIDLSAVFTYSTGRPATFPVAKFRFLEDEDVAFFQTRNGSRGPDNHRLDLAMSFRFNAVKKIWRGEWKVSLYNAYGRDNPFSVFFDDLPGQPPGAFKLAVLGNPFFSASYTLKL